MRLVALGTDTMGETATIFETMYATSGAATTVTVAMGSSSHR
jgi:hypothetical protein